MKKLIQLLVFCLILGIPGAAFAAKGAESCGIGPRVLKGSGILSQVVVQFTNVTLLPTNAVSVTVGTSGCGYSEIVDKDAPRLQYIRFNYANLAEDAAKGEGIYISSFARLMGCSETGQSTLTQAVHDDFGTFFRSDAAPDGSEQFYNAVKEEISRNPQLSSSCF